jgi:hypothetical protein
MLKNYLKTKIMDLLNNSNEMNTIVETFVIEETAPLIYDNEQLDKWNELVSNMGLTGQTKIVNTTKSPVPFLFMKNSLVATFNTLCPCHTNIKDYSLTPIPVEILSLVQLSINENYFDEIQIWYDDKTLDPACIGLRYENEEHREKKYTWYRQKYLIGKWGDVRRSFEELFEIAKKRFVSEKIIQLKSDIKQKERELEDVELTAERTFGSTVTLDF